MNSSPIAPTVSPQEFEKLDFLNFSETRKDTSEFLMDSLVHLVEVHKLRRMPDEHSEHECHHYDDDDSHATARRGTIHHDLIRGREGDIFEIVEVCLSGRKPDKILFLSR